MRVIYKERIVDMVSREISIAEMNGKMISYIELTEEEWKQVEYERKTSPIMSSIINVKSYRFQGELSPYIEIYGIKLYKEGTI